MATLTKEPPAIFNLARIQQRRVRNRWQLQCEDCSGWARKLYAVRNPEKTPVRWLCRRCVNRKRD